jgi:single-strand DNA-binding protein
MPNLNKVHLIGHITRDVELRYTQSGTAVADFGLAINRHYTTQSGEKKEETCFVDVTFWDKQAETLQEYVGKGDPLYVEGRLKLDRWESNDGQKRSKLGVVGQGFQFLGSGERKQGERKPQSEPEDVPDEEIPF